jgi:hypothetical protein
MSDLLKKAAFTNDRRGPAGTVGFLVLATGAKPRNRRL